MAYIRRATGPRTRPAQQVSIQITTYLGAYPEHMERRQHNRIPVELNAVLIGEKTIPRGCKVSNLSQQGILLECVSDGRVSTFQEGNIVNIHLLFQQSGGCKYLTKTAEVKHTDENRIGVEFNQPDSDLLEFTRPCRIDSNHTPEALSADISAPVIEATDLHTATNADFINKMPGTAAVTETEEPDMTTGKHRMVFFAGLIFMIIAAGLALGAYLYATKINNRISALETVTENHTGKIAEMQEWAFPASMMEGKFAYLNAQMKALTDSFAKLETRLAAEASTPPAEITPPPGQPVPPVDSTSPATESSEPDVRIVAPTPQASASTDKATAATAPARPVKKPPVAGAKTAAIREPSAPVGAAAGSWVINLASSPDKAAAERFAARALRNDIPVVLVKAGVKGRDYWRVQLTGFASRNAARSYAGPVSEKLGLKDVWIFRQ